jgi:hypothetical protein
MPTRLLTPLSIVVRVPVFAMTEPLLFSPTNLALSVPPSTPATGITSSNFSECFDRRRIKARSIFNEAVGVIRLKSRPEARPTQMSS